MVSKEISTVTKWLQKCGAFNWEQKAPMKMVRTLNKIFLRLRQEQNILPKVMVYAYMDNTYSSRKIEKAMREISISGGFQKNR